MSIGLEKSVVGEGKISDLVIGTLSLRRVEQKKLNYSEHQELIIVSSGGSDRGESLGWFSPNV